MVAQIFYAADKKPTAQKRKKQRKIERTVRSAAQRNDFSEYQYNKNKRQRCVLLANGTLSRNLLFFDFEINMVE